MNPEQEFIPLGSASPQRSNPTQDENETFDSSLCPYCDGEANGFFKTRAHPIGKTGYGTADSPTRKVVICPLFGAWELDSTTKAPATYPNPATNEESGQR